MRNGSGEGETTQKDGGCSSKGEGEGRMEAKQDGGVQADGEHGGNKGMWKMEGGEGEWRAVGVVEEDGECSMNAGKVRMNGAVEVRMMVAWCQELRGSDTNGRAITRKGT